MKKQKKKLLIAAGVLVLLGGMIFSSAMAVNHWDFSKLSTVRYKTETFEIKEDLESITVETETPDIAFALSEDGKCRVNCYTPEGTENDASVIENVLTVKSDYSSKKWYENISITTETPSITVYLPEKEFKLLKIKSDTSDVEIPGDFSFDDIDISVQTGEIITGASASDKIRIVTDTGDVRAENLTAKEMKLSLETGTATLKNIKCEEKLEVKTDTGDIKISDSDADEIKLNSDTGNISGSFLSDKIFAVQSKMGNVDVPESFSGGKCEISTDTGDIKIEIKH